MAIMASPSPVSSSTLLFRDIADTFKNLQRLYGHGHITASVLAFPDILYCVSAGGEGTRQGTLQSGTLFLVQIIVFCNTVDDTGDHFIAGSCPLPDATSPNVTE